MLQNHEELLKTIGFEPAGMNMEWKWHTASRQNGDFDENIAILRALLAALQSLSSPTSASNLSLEEIALASLSSATASASTTTATATEADDLEEKGPAVVSSSANASVSTSTTTSTSSIFQTGSTSSYKSPPDLDSFMARLGQKASIVNEAKSSSVPTPSATSAATPSTLTADAASTPSEAGPSYPKSFTDVMELIKKGEPVPGIREIEDKLSVDSSALLSEAAAPASDETTAAALPAKPWEKLKA